MTLRCFNSSTVSADSIIPCFRTALGLYGDNSLSVDQPTHQSTAMDVLLYPNPVAVGEQFNIRLSDSELSTVLITDMTERIVSEKTSAAMDFQVTAPETNGLYLISIKQKEQVAHVKLLVR
jgi:hypothetical protein